MHQEKTPRLRKKVPQVMTNLRRDSIHLPQSIRNASGINVNGKRIKSLIFTTDVAIITNNNADAVLAVYPFTPSPAVIEALMMASSLPIISGVGGGTTQGERSAYMALMAESVGSMAVIVNAPTPIETIRQIEEIVDIPIIMTVVSKYTDIDPLLEAGVDIVNISGGKDTALIVRQLREKYPDLPIIATGGASDESINATIEAGANAITYTPPTTSELFHSRMKGYREKEAQKAAENEQA
ncbi:hypothetical protein [Allofustis seminis]|uniref:hypothetical protein n=1 Tax=Allofustis seminis TaxID=166939 RepID=UPI00035CB06B|nr:hypothetical protein [Allofustis seminis]